MADLTLSIQGMHCGACVRRVTQQLQQIPGVKPQEVNVGSARVAYDPREASPAVMVAALDRAGFKATPASTEEQG